MSESIFLLQDGGSVVNMQVHLFESEDDIQQLIERAPEVLTSDPQSSLYGKSLALIAREMYVPDDTTVSRWSLDHLFVDNDAILTLVEVKRSTDPRIRREVVGQMLDYAANSVLYLSISTIRDKFEARYGSDTLALDFLTDNETTDEFWDRVNTNLQAGKIRLLFVADEIPSELRSIIEFLNRQMNPAEVLAMEIKQYTNEATGHRTLVPRTVGITASTNHKRHSHSRRTMQDSELRDTLTITVGGVNYRIDQYSSYAIKITNLDLNGEEKALPILKYFNRQLGLGIEETYEDGRPRNTRQIGDWVIKELRRKGF